MGTKVQNLPGYYYSMRDLNEESSSCGWPLFYGDKTLRKGNYSSNYLPCATADVCSLYDKDVVKRMMLEHEAIFKNQVYELHRLYRIQRDLMNDFKRKESHSHRNQIPVEASFSTDPLISQITTEDGQKWHVSGFPLENSAYAKTSASAAAAAGAHSPMSSIKGMNKQAVQFPSPDSLKDAGVLESRPSKVRRKMFDLQLPADEYDDTEESEKLSDEKISGSTLFFPDRSCKNGKEDNVKTWCPDTAKSEQSLSRRNGLADLNEPIQVEETYDSPYVHFPSHNSCAATEFSDLNASVKQKPQFFGLCRDQLLNSHHGTDSWAHNNGYLEKNRSGKGGIPFLAEAGQGKGNLQHMPQLPILEKSLLSSQTMQGAFSKAHEPASDYLHGRSTANMWREKTVSDLHISERNHEYSVAPLHRHGLNVVAPSSDLLKSWSHSASSWGVANCSLSQNMMSVQTPLSLNASSAVNRSSQSYQSNGILENSWPLNINSKPNLGFQCDVVPLKNGFYRGSSSGSKEPSMNISSISYDYLNHNNDCKIIPEHLFNGSTKYYKGSNSNCNDMKSGKEIDLNVILSNGSSNNSLVPQSGVGVLDGEQKRDEHRAVLPWLRATTTSKSEVQNTDRCITAGELSFLHTAKEPGGKFMHRVASVSCSNNIDSRRTGVSESSSNKKILGVPIFDMPRVSPKKELSSIVSIQIPSDLEAVGKNWKNRMFDMNLPCDDDVVELDKEEFTETVVSKTRSPTTGAGSRNLIDLNLSMSEDEGSFTTIPNSNATMKVVIDLEAPAVPETEEDLIPVEKKLETSLASPQDPEDSVEKQQHELIRNAAETIVVLSSLSCDQVDVVINSPPESPMADPLRWFVDVVSSCKDILEQSDIVKEKDCEDNEDSMDYFEAMTLKLEETKEEDYMPKPLVPENFKVEEAMSILPTRTRRGAARRGRPRRDFQRDILPGLTSLSRNEVTEDIQTFGGLMKATGHSWQSGITRRNGCGRGRRRTQVTPPPLPLPPPVTTNETNIPLMQQLNSIEVGLDDGSLTGWGNATRTRRPRRQRCLAGNPPLIPIT